MTLGTMFDQGINTTRPEANPLNYWAGLTFAHKVFQLPFMYAHRKTIQTRYWEAHGKDTLLPDTVVSSEAVGQDGAYPAPPSGALILLGPSEPPSILRLAAGPAVVGLGIGLAVASLVLDSNNAKRQRDIDVALAKTEGVWPVQLKDEERDHGARTESLQSELDRDEKLVGPLILGGVVVVVVGLLLMVRRPAKSEFRLSRNSAALAGGF